MKPNPIRQPDRPRPSFPLKPCAAMLLTVLLTACGGGGGGGDAPPPAADGGSGSGAPVDNGGGTPVPDTGATTTGLTVQTEREQATVGGAPVLLTASGGAADADVQWTLAPGSPGSLSADRGSVVAYIPPPAGSTVGSGPVNIIASKGDVNVTVIVILGDVTVNNGTSGAGSATPPAQDPGAPAPAPGIYLVAGNDFGAGMADGPGTTARFDTPDGIARDGQGNLYVADRFNSVIRKITPAGVVSTFAGMPGQAGSADGTGSAARFAVPSGIAVDNAGNVIVGDRGNLTLRRITPDGTVTTIIGSAGSAVDGQGSAVAFSASPMSVAVGADGIIYVAERTLVRRVAPDGSTTILAGKSGVVGVQDGPVADATFNSLKGIAVDSAGNVYVVDGGLERAGGMLSTTYFTSASVRRIGVDGIVSTIAGTNAAGIDSGVFGFADGPGTQARFNYPEGIAIDADGILYVNDRANNAVRRVAADGSVSTVAGVAGQPGSADGSIDTARLGWPTGIATGAGALFITDSRQHTVRRIDPDAGVTTVAGAAPLSGSSDGLRSSAQFNAPLSVTRDAAGNLYVADTGNQTIRRIALDGTVSTLAGAPGVAGFADGSGAAARFSLPRDVTVDALGNLFVADFSNRVVRRIGTGGEVTTYAGTPNETGSVDGPAATARFVEPQAVATDSNGNLFVADRAGDSIRLVTPQGIVSTFAGDPNASGPADGTGSQARFFFPQDIVADVAGNLYVIDGGSAIRKITPQGVVTTLAGVAFQNGTQDGMGTAARFNYPQSLAVDEEGNVYVAESRAIRRISPLGIVSTVAGPGIESARNIWHPSGIVVTGTRTLVYTSGNGVFELRLP